MVSARSDARENGYPPIEDYAVIGDCRCAALVGKNGSIDWLCLPRFDSPSVFAAILDPEKGGRFVIRPNGRHTVSRRYVKDTNVLATTFTSDSGIFTLTDLMPVYTEEILRRELCPERYILRVVECLEGNPEIEILYQPRPDYGRILPRLQQRGALGWYCVRGDRTLILRSEVPLKLSEDRSEARGRVRVATGDRFSVAVVFAESEPAVLPPLGDDAAQRIAFTVNWWREWVSRCTYSGPYRDAVIRSLLTLKLMIYAPSGAVIAAPTSSLPEKIGGHANWDYRFCWLRDASFTIRAFFDLGYMTEGKSFLSWLVHTTRLTFPELSVLYNVYGETRIREETMDHLGGYRHSRPVRMGNKVVRQLQLDIYGEIIESAAEYVRKGNPLDRATARILVGLGKTVCRKWRMPDDGIWEVRSGAREHTYARALCWVALDRLLSLHEKGVLKVPVDRFTREREAIRHDIETRGYDPAIASYTSIYGERRVDVSLLLLPIYGYQDPRSPRMVSTCARIREELGRNGLLQRASPGYRGLIAGEGAFAAAGFWDVECLVLQGQIEKARQQFERNLEYANDVGLYAEEIDTATGQALGNFPQSYTHVGLIDAAVRIAAYEQKR